MAVRARSPVRLDAVRHSASLAHRSHTYVCRLRPRVGLHSTTVPPTDERAELVRAFGERVRDLRLALPHEDGRPVSQERLAERCELVRPHIGMIERGERAVELVTIVRLARGLGVDPVELLRGIGDETSE